MKCCCHGDLIACFCDANDAGCHGSNAAGFCIDFVWV